MNFEIACIMHVRYNTSLLSTDKCNILLYACMNQIAHSFKRYSGLQPPEVGANCTETSRGNNIITTDVKSTTLVR
jgi:hypothetical protein